jgi:hypothetical protein
MNTMSPMLVTVIIPPRKGVGKAPGAFDGAVCTTVIFQNGLFVFTSTVMRLVLLVAVKVRGRPLGELAVTGTSKDLPAGILADDIGSITGAAAKTEPMDSRQQSGGKNFMHEAPT